MSIRSAPRRCSGLRDVTAIQDAADGQWSIWHHRRMDGQLEAIALTADDLEGFGLAGPLDRGLSESQRSISAGEAVSSGSLKLPSGQRPRAVYDDPVTGHPDHRARPRGRAGGHQVDAAVASSSTGRLP